MQELIEITIGKMLEDIAKRYPDDEMVKYTDRDYRRTWKEFDTEVEEVAKGFLAMGIQKGDHVAIWASNVPEWLLTFYACTKIGAVCVTVNTAYKVFEIEYLLRQSDSKMLVLMDEYKGTSYVDIINELCPNLKNARPGEYSDPKLPHLKSVVYAGKNDTAPAGMYHWREIFTHAKNTPDEMYRAIYESISPYDVSNMQYTSGTTGFPKGVMLTHYNIVNNGMAIGDCMKLTHQDKLCVVVPFFHCFGMVLALMACLTHDTPIVPVDLYSPVKVMKAIQDEKCTAFHGVPTMFITILDHPDFEQYDFSHLRTGIMAGSPCPIKVMEQVIEKMHMKEITITYGMTETSPASTMTTTDDPIEVRVATVGKTIPHCETKIVDPETGETLGPGVPGEFCCRGYNIMKGYYNMEEATRQIIDEDGWLHSGDLATVDEKGYYKITGRIKDMIIRGGENIYPKEIEEFLYTHENVKDVQVIGVPSRRYGEEIMACVVLKDGQSTTEDEIKDFVRANMARHKIPSYVAFVDAFPMTASGKIQKYKLREWAVEQYNLQEEASIETA